MPFPRQSACDFTGERFLLPGQNPHGIGLSENFVGDTMVVSNIDTGQDIAQVREFWWDFNLCDDMLTVRLDKQDFNTEFVYLGLAADFIQSSFDAAPPLLCPPSRLRRRPLSSRHNSPTSGR